ncbi:hypothetical protein RGV33_20695 [Pseudomonas sp. Bout1]|uniref:hypothetical protein n=1 Tax=Pseudomonas sp. Bout1 TaxID=3048600 RepID=UPI002AB581E9|nr:hypothetical protein [Pseudomonas sp. Bout1]MDY7534067.1 hypothetical protein [Pseudomonas sp. Bout1]MEB0186004.1 hypothetical protein [Pseudomonas sp. Bout1]
MKARIEKKLSKRLVRLCPSVYRRAWIDKDEPSRLAYKQNTRVSHVLSVGGGTDWQGDGEDAFTTWADWLSHWPWHGPFAVYPDGHEHQFFPNTEGFRPTTRNLLKLAADCERASKAKP